MRAVSSRVVRVAVVLLLVAAWSASSAADPDAVGGAWVGILPDPAQSTLGEDAPSPTYFVCRIRDGETGAPVAGARWIRTPEWVAPWRARPDAALSVGLADRDGVAFVPALAHAWSEDCHWLVVAPGYAPAYEYGMAPEAQVFLERGVPFLGRVVDALGRPVTGATVETLGGCSHGTASARATTDASGTFLFDRVPSSLPGQIWVEGPGIEADLIALSTPVSLGGDSVVLAMEPGVTYEGRVVDLLDRPVAGVVVRAYNEQRGPAATTDEDGHFVIRSVDPWEGLFFFPPADLLACDARRMIDDVYPGVPMRVVVTPTGVLEEEERAQIVIRTIDAAGAAVGGISVAVVRDATGRGPKACTAWEEPARADDPPLGTDRVDVIPGTYRLRPAEPFDAYVFDPVDVTVPADETVAVTLTVRPRPRLRVEGAIPIDATLVLAVSGASVCAPDPEEPWSPPLPAKEAAALRVEIEGRPPFFFPVGAAANGIRRVVLSLPELHRIALPKGATEAELLDGSRDAFFVARDGSLETDARGVLTLRWTQPDGNRYEAPVRLPEVPGAVVSVEAAAGRPRPGEVHVVAVEVDDAGASREVERVAASPGERVVIERAGWRTLRAVAPPRGESILRYGTATIRLRIHDEDGPCDAVALVGGEVYEVPGGILERRGFVEETLRILVARRDEYGPGRALRITCRRGTVHEVDVVLP